MNAENVAQLLAATVAPERELAQKAEQQLEEMQKVFILILKLATFFAKNVVLTPTVSGFGNS